MANITGNNDVIVVERHYIPIALYTDIYNPSRLYNYTSRYTTHPFNTSPFNTSPFNTQPTNTQPTNTQPRTRGIFSFFTNPSIINSRFTIPNTTNTAYANNTSNINTTTDTNALEEAFMNYFNVLLGADRTTANLGLNNIQIINSTHVTTFTNEQPDDDNATNSDNSTNSNYSNSNSCAICVAPYNEGDILLTINTCNHNFHQNCIQTWLETHNTCPLCRANVYIPPNSPTNTSNASNASNTPNTNNATNATNTNNATNTPNTPTYTRLFNYYYPSRYNVSDTVNNDTSYTPITDEYYDNPRDIDAMD